MGLHIFTYLETDESSGPIWVLVSLKKKGEKNVYTFIKSPSLENEIVSILNQATVTNVTNASTIDSAAYAIMQVCENTIFHTNEICKESSANELRYWLERCCIAKCIVNFDTYEVNGDGSRRTRFDH